MDEFTDAQKIELLAKKVMFALKNLDLPRGCVSLDTSKGAVRLFDWIDDFCEALQKCGFMIEAGVIKEWKYWPTKREK